MCLLLGYILDLIVGDPHRIPHPIRAIGLMIALGEKVIRRVFPKGKIGERLGGGVLTILVIVISWAIPTFLLLCIYAYNMYLGMTVETIMCYQLLAIKSLKVESTKVYYHLKKEDIESARYALSMIVGRDTANLKREGIIKAAVETVAENSSDGAVAPLAYMAIGGASLGFIYKAINTLDSMIGYKNDRYKYFGTLAARLDDGIGFIPARLGGLLMVVAAGLCGYNWKRGWQIFCRDRYKHASPNSAQTEAAMAGALGIQLAGDAYYFGNLYKKEAIGDKERDVEAEDIVRANKLHYTVAFLTLVLSMIVIILRNLYFYGLV